MLTLRRHSTETRRARPSLAAGGFTIVELMIATLVFAVILVVITTGVIHFTNQYYKGVNSSTTQTLARSVTDQVSQATQFSGSLPTTTTAGFPAGSGVVCVGSQEYYYVLGTKITGATTVGLHEFAVPNGVCYNGATTGPNYYKSAASGYNNGRELLQTNMRLTHFSVVNDGTGTFTVTVGIAYGDNDLLCAPTSVANSCKTNAANLTNFTVNDLTCKPGNGSQFCDVVNLTTSVQPRVNFGG